MLNTEQISKYLYLACACEDFNPSSKEGEDCFTYKKAGYCEHSEFKEWMQKYCQLTCGFCENKKGV